MVFIYSVFNAQFVRTFQKKYPCACMHIFLPLQPRSRSAGGDCEADFDLDEEIAPCAEDKVVFNSSDEEEEDDSWFDALVTRALSDVSDISAPDDSPEVAPTELDDDTQPVDDSQPVMDSQVLIVEPDSQFVEPDDFMGYQLEPVEPFESQLEASQGPDSLPLDSKKGLDVSSRPVARPLQATEDMHPKACTDKNGSNVINLDGDDTQDVKGSATEAAIRARRIASLKAKIAHLEAMQVSV